MSQEADERPAPEGEPSPRRPRTRWRVVTPVAVLLSGGLFAVSALNSGGTDLRPGQSAHGKDAKTALQEWLQGRKMKLPLYTVVATMGQAHVQTFEVQCQIHETGQSARGTGSSRRAAEQAAAAQMLQQLQNHTP